MVFQRQDYHQALIALRYQFEEQCYV